MRMRATVPIPMYMPPPSLLDPASASGFDRAFPGRSDPNRTLPPPLGQPGQPAPSCRAERPPKQHPRRQRPTCLLPRDRSHVRRRMPRVPPPLASLQVHKRRARWPPHRLAPDASEPFRAPAPVRDVPLLRRRRDVRRDENPSRCQAAAKPTGSRNQQEQRRPPGKAWVAGVVRVSSIAAVGRRAVRSTPALSITLFPRASLAKKAAGVV